MRTEDIAAKLPGISGTLGGLSFAVAALGLTLYVRLREDPVLGTTARVWLYDMAHLPAYSSIFFLLSCSCGILLWHSPQSRALAFICVFLFSVGILFLLVSLVMMIIYTCP